MVFIFDNNCSPRLTKGLSILEEGNSKSPLQSTVYHITDFIPANSPDEDVIKTAGEKSATIVTYDRDFKAIKSHADLYHQHQCGVVFFRSYKDKLIYWDIVVTFIGYWEDIKQKVNTVQKPFILQVTNKGISEMSFSLVFLLCFGYTHA
jgi:predicted nuclease of predicted toxin-antitoxin system